MFVILIVARWYGTLLVLDGSIVSVWLVWLVWLFAAGGCRAAHPGRATTKCWKNEKCFGAKTMVKCKVKTTQPPYPFRAKDNIM